jgi:hypothetical protein
MVSVARVFGDVGGRLHDGDEDAATRILGRLATSHELNLCKILLRNHFQTVY